MTCYPRHQHFLSCLVSVHLLYAGDDSNSGLLSVSLGIFMTPTFELWKIQPPDPSSSVEYWDCKLKTHREPSRGHSVYSLLPCLSPQ